MPISKDPAILRGSEIFYRGLLHFYPPELSRKFGDEMTDVFTTLLRDAMYRGEPVEILILWRSALWELLTVAVPSRLASNAVMAGALSLLASATLFLVFFRAIN